MKTKLYKINFLLSIIFLLSYSCKKGGGDFFSAVGIHYVDANGRGLFTNGMNGYFKDSVNVYDYQNGIKTPLVISNQSAYFVDWYPSTIVINGIINKNVINRYTINIIHLKQGVDDTLRVHLTKDEQMGASYDSAWYNGKFIPDMIKKDTFTIVK